MTNVIPMTCKMTASGNMKKKSADVTVKESLFHTYDDTCISFELDENNAIASLRVKNENDQTDIPYNALCMLLGKAGLVIFPGAKLLELSGVLDKGLKNEDTDGHKIN